MNLVKPMLATKATDKQIEILLNNNGILHASPKLDGIRCTIQSGQAYSRSLKLIRNKHVQSLLSRRSLLEGLDGELIVGNPTAHDVYRTTSSGIMREEGEPNFKFYIFDTLELPNCNYTQRHAFLKSEEIYGSYGSYIQILESTIIESMEQLYTYENACLNGGFEGVIIRDTSTEYKHGRATAKSGELIKVKRFTDAEAIILAVEEQMHNANEATTNELGRTQRSSHQENKIPMGTMGAIVCKDIETHIEFNIGTGFSAQLRQEMWNSKEGSNTVIGKMVKYKSFKIGVKDAPRHPVFLGFRDPSDM